MIVKPKELRDYLSKNKLTKKDLAAEIEVHINEIKKLLKGQAVGKKTATKFINYIGADQAQDLIDWQALGIENPL